MSVYIVWSASLDSVILKHLSSSERDDRLLAVGLVAGALLAASSLLAQHLYGADRADGDKVVLLAACVVNGLDCALDLKLVRVGCHLEGVLANDLALVLNALIAIAQ